MCVEERKMYSKSNIQSEMITKMGRQFGRSINMAILDDVLEPYKGPIHVWKIWKTRKGRTMRRIGARIEVRKWLEETHPQFGKASPSWWKFDGGINIADEKLWLMMLLKFGE